MRPIQDGKKGQDRLYRTRQSPEKGEGLYCSYSGRQKMIRRVKDVKFSWTDTQVANCLLIGKVAKKDKLAYRDVS
jgi:hypothetical protein